MDGKSRTKNLIKGTGIYAIGTFGTKILSFLIVPIYTYYIVTEDMGLYDILMSTINLLTPIITMQISDAAYRWILTDESRQDLYIRTTIQVLMINCSLFAFLIIAGNYFVTIPYCYYFTAILISSRMLATVQKLLRAVGNQKLFAISGLCYSIVFLLLNVLQICILHQGVNGLFQSAVVANIVALISIILLEPKIRINYFQKLDTKLVAKFYKFSVPLVPNYLNWWVINASDRYIVAAFLGMSANGVLAIAHKFPTVLQTILNLFTTSWQDVSVAEKETDIGEYYTQVFRTYSKVALSLLWPLIPITKIVILLIMSQSYKSACNFVAFYYLGTVYQSFASFYGVGYLKSTKTGNAFSTSICGAIVNAVINLLFIRIIGLQAAAISTFIGFLVMWLVREKQNRDELGIKTEWFEIISYTSLAVIVAVLSNMLPLVWNISLFVIGTFLFFVVNKNYIINIVALIKRKIIKENNHEV